MNTFGLESKPMLKWDIVSMKMNIVSICWKGNNNWIPAILPTSLRHIFQRALVEEKKNLLEKVYQVSGVFARLGLWLRIR